MPSRIEIYPLGKAGRGTWTGQVKLTPELRKLWIFQGTSERGTPEAFVCKCLEDDSATLIRRASPLYVIEEKGVVTGVKEDCLAPHAEVKAGEEFYLEVNTMRQGPVICRVAHE